LSSSPFDGAPTAVVGIGGSVMQRFTPNALKSFLSLGSAAYTSTSAYYSSGSTVANSALWNNQSYGGAYSNGTIQRVLIYNVSTGFWEGTTATPFATFLGLGSYAYRNSGLAELTGATFTGSITATGFFESSDTTLKNIFHRYTPTNGVGAIKYTWKKGNDGIHFGYAAQDVQRVNPSMVGKNTDGTLTVNYTEVHTMKIQALEERIKKLESIIETLIKQK
jgi:hypothetical protein